MIQQYPPNFALGPSAYNYNAYAYYNYQNMPQYNQALYVPNCQNRHQRRNSETRIHHQLPILDEFDPNMEMLLPKSLLKEFDVCSNTPQSSQKTKNQSNQQSADSIENLESIINEKGVDAGKTFIMNLIKKQFDPKEQGKTLRNAAEMAKRISEVSLSLEFYSLSTQYDPTTPASWIDRAKLLDEFGNYEKAEAVLREGISKAQHCEQLIRKLLKSFERTNKFEQARQLLGSLLNDSNIDRETVLVEGALFELRQCHVEEAMLILRGVKGPNGWKSNIYSELVQFFEKSGLIMEVFDIVEEGAKLNPRNAIICQSLLKNQRDPHTVINLFQESTRKWTAEFTDKMAPIVCETLASSGYLGLMRTLLAEVAAKSSFKQRYKLFYTASTIELIYGDASLSPLLLDKALSITPFKAKPMVMILLAKVYELNKEYDQALLLFEQASTTFSAEWRVFLEFAQFYVHRNNIPKAIQVLTEALKIHHGSGRLWAFRVQLEAFNSVETQISVLRSAIQAVPKSGEVWCEAARIVLNPQTRYFNLQSAKQFLEFAYRFTPQHGDSLVEMIRVELLEKGFNADLREIQKLFVCSEGNYGLLFIYLRKLSDQPVTIFDDAVREVKEDIMRNSKVYSRAIARSSFVVRSIFEEEEKFKQSKEIEPPSKFAFGLTNIGQMMLNPSLCTSPEQLLAIVLGTSAAAQ